MVPLQSNYGRVENVFSSIHFWDWVFPESQPYYPFDSIQEVTRARAAAWVIRLDGLSGDDRAYAIGGWKSVPLAELAAAAGNDSLAQRIFDVRIKALATAPAEKSFVLFKAVATFANPTQDSARLTHNLVLAEDYLKRLHAIPAGGYTTQHDSLAVLERQWQAEDTLIPAYAIVQQTAKVLEHARALIGYATVMGVYTRFGVIDEASAQIVRALKETRVHRAALAAFEPTVMAAAHRATLVLPAGATADDVAYLQHLEARAKEYFEQIEQWLALLDRPAPAIAAHAWLNTPDSLYDSIPRRRTFNDGRVHAVMFLQSRDDPIPPAVLSRIQQEFSNDVDVLLVQSTEGYAGPDIVGPLAEVDWLKRYLIGLRHLTLPIAVWAGTKVSTGYVPEGHYAISSPVPEPNTKPYHQVWWLSGCALIDRQGRLRYFMDAARRTDEIRLRQRLRELIAEPAPASSR